MASKYQPQMSSIQKNYMVILLKKMEIRQIMQRNYRFNLTTKKNYLFPYINTEMDFERIRNLFSIIFGKNCQLFSYAEFQENRLLRQNCTRVLFVKKLSQSQVEWILNQKQEVVQRKQIDKVIVIEGVTDYDNFLSSLKCNLPESVVFVNVKDYTFSIKIFLLIFLIKFFY